VALNAAPNLLDTGERKMTKILNVKTLWDVVMDERKNPLKGYPLPTAHMIMQTLAWMWTAIFSLAIGSYVMFGILVVGHVLLIAGLFITLMVFENASYE
jgi:hypothetical protein